MALWVSGGYKNDWIDEPTAARLSRADLLVVQDLFPSPLSERATYVLPAAAFPERDGSYVNRGDQLQSVGWAIRPPTGVRTEGSLFWELLGRRPVQRPDGAWRSGRGDPLFPVAREAIPDVGVNLKVNLLAEPKKREWDGSSFDGEAVSFQPSAFSS